MNHPTAFRNGYVGCNAQKTLKWIWKKIEFIPSIGTLAFK